MDSVTLHFFSDEVEKLAADAFTRRLLRGQMPKLRAAAERLNASGRYSGASREEAMAAMALKKKRLGALEARGVPVNSTSQSAAGRSYRRNQGIFRGEGNPAQRRFRNDSGQDMSVPAWKRHGKRSPEEMAKSRAAKAEAAKLRAAKEQEAAKLRAAPSQAAPSPSPSRGSTSPAPAPRRGRGGGGGGGGTSSSGGGGGRKSYGGAKTTATQSTGNGSLAPALTAAGAAGVLGAGALYANRNK